MEKGKVIQLPQDQPQQAGLILSVEEKKRISDFFGVLIQIDRRVNMTKSYGNKPNK